MEATVYNTKGKETGKVQLPEEVFGLKWNSDLVSQVFNSMNTNARTNVAHTKGRGDVRGGGKKPWAQKGTGRARHGSSRSPIWVGGGVAHGPSKDKNFDRKVNKKMKAKALYTVLSRKLKDGEIIFVDSISFDAPKTKEAKEVLMNLSSANDNYKYLATKRKNAAIIATDEKDINTEKSFANFGSLEVSEARNLNVVNLLNTKYVVLENPEKIISMFSAKKILAKKNVA